MVRYLEVGAVLEMSSRHLKMFDHFFIIAHFPSLLLSYGILDSVCLGFIVVGDQILGKPTRHAPQATFTAPIKMAGAC